MQLSAADQYNNLQQTAANTLKPQAMQASKHEDTTTADSKNPQDNVSFSGRIFIYSQIAQQFDVSAISFEQVQNLKSELFKSGLIGMAGSDALTIATQGQPNHSSFNLAQVTSEFYQHAGNAYLRPVLQPMQAIFANLEVLHQAPKAVNN